MEKSELCARKNLKNYVLVFLIYHGLARSTASVSAYLNGAQLELIFENCHNAGHSRQVTWYPWIENSNVQFDRGQTRSAEIRVHSEEEQNTNVINQRGQSRERVYHPREEHRQRPGYNFADTKSTVAPIDERRIWGRQPIKVPSTVATIHAKGEGNAVGKDGAGATIKLNSRFNFQTRPRNPNTHRNSIPIRRKTN